RPNNNNPDGHGKGPCGPDTVRHEPDGIDHSISNRFRFRALLLFLRFGNLALRTMVAVVLGVERPGHTALSGAADSLAAPPDPEVREAGTSFVQSSADTFTP